jgi:hypothetical protein
LDRIRVSSRQFPIVLFWSSISWLRPFIAADPRLFCPIRVYLHFSYKYHCTAHNSAVLFWTQNRLDQIKVIARAHPCHYFHTKIAKNRLGYILAIFSQTSLVTLSRNLSWLVYVWKMPTFAQLQVGMFIFR